MKTKKKIIEELKAIRKEQLSFFDMEYLNKDGELADFIPLDVLVRSIIDEYRKCHGRNAKRVAAVETDIYEVRKSMQFLADIVMRLDTVANKWQAAMSEQTRINEMLTKRVEAMEQRIEKHECTNPFTGENLRSGILNVRGDAGDHYSNTVTTKPADNATLTRVKVNALDPETVKEAIANGFGSDGLDHE